MPTINGRTLVLAIQAMDFKIADIERRLDAQPPEEDSELESLLLSYENAAEALKQAYQEALREADNLPPYETLVRRSDIAGQQGKPFTGAKASAGE